MDAKQLGAQPVSPENRIVGNRGDYHNETSGGITLRQHFAGLIYTQFLRGSVIPPGFDATEQFEHGAKVACVAADALLAELAKET